ncbi:NAD-dependent epimerase [Pedobacter quisquiliarum]|uniref:NAD-dependent epimerase n=1 Tax=Pedobacter quisquiliarum TaxID=1834438 RepID=A0A916XJ57_9SPHI|nr:NAD-dependent epimerase/dehydratase family protein [Pedobacter quisquiliarum]GGC74270.1 NAD-dependent epimerase [Pedobacter quisquiliarum]
MILITGATGFLGAELAHQLTSQGLQVRALKRETGIIPDLLKGNLNLEWFTADINEPATLEEAFAGVTQVYHCAAVVSFDPKDKAKMIHVNIEGTSNVVNLCVEYGVRLLHVSSVAALGEPKKDQEITEDDYWEYSPHVHTYAISKYEGEMEVWRGISEGLNAVIVNPSVIIGANAGYQGSGALFKLVQEGLSFYTNGSTGLVDVTDVAKCMIQLMNSTLEAERYTISAANLSFKEMFGQIAEGFGKKPPSREAKPWMLGIAWRAARLASFFTGRSFGITSDTVRSSTSYSYYSNKKIKDTIGINFKPLDESIREVCAALQKNHS